MTVSDPLGDVFEDGEAHGATFRAQAPLLEAGADSAVGSRRG
jgi:hypothetical protein